MREEEIIEDQNPKAKSRADRNSDIFIGFNVVITGPIFPLETVWMWSRFTAQSLGMPSSFVNKTSVGISRMVEVIGATDTSPKKSNAESRVRITTGRFLSGLANLYQRTSPLFMVPPKPVLSPNPQTLPV